MWKTMEIMWNKYAVCNSLGTHDPHDPFANTFLGLGLLVLVVIATGFILSPYQAFQTGNFLYLPLFGRFALICLTKSYPELQKGAGVLRSSQFTTYLS
jgi:hypothetical protein